MKNYEKYADEIREYKGCNFCIDFVCLHILKIEDCDYIGCSRCNMLQMLWLMEECKEPEEPEEPEEPKVDWSKVEVDTPILVSNSEDGDWYKRYFAKYNGKVFAWSDGRTSWNETDVRAWDYAKLAETEEECKEPEVDWSKVEVNTPILVRDYESQEWEARHFAKYEDGVIYTWDGGSTSWTSKGNVTEWKYAKLAEGVDE